MKVFLVYVRDENYFHLLPAGRNGRRSDPGRIQVMAFPPLGIQTLAPVLRRCGHDVRMFDTCHPRMNADAIAEALERERPDAVALSFLSVTAYPALRALALRLKARSPGTPIVVGGAFASMNADRVLRDCPAIDGVGVGEGEDLLPDYLEHLDDPGAVAGLVWRKGDEVVRNRTRPLLADLDRFPYPDRTTLPIDYVESLPLDVPAIVSLDKFCTMQTSRGCPYTCIYCDIPSLSDGKWRHRSAEHVLGEMQELEDAGYKSVYLTDDHFLLKRKRIADICTGIVERKLRFRWGCEGRVDAVAIDHFGMMRRANCDMLAFGIESGSQRVLDRLGKRQTLEQIEHALGEAKRQGIGRIHGFFVIASPGETAEEVLSTFRYAARLPIDTFGFNRLAVYRGTPLWKEYVERGILDDELDWNKSFKCCDIDPTALSNAEASRLRRRGYALLLGRRILGRPRQTLDLLRIFGRHMKKRDLLRLLAGPFRKHVPISAAELPVRLSKTWDPVTAGAGAASAT